VKSVRLDADLEAKLERAARAFGHLAVRFHPRCAGAPLRGSARRYTGGAAGFRPWHRQEFRRPGRPLWRGVPRGAGPGEAAMILTDAGPFIALLDRGEEHHRACVECHAAHFIFGGGSTGSRITRTGVSIGGMRSVKASNNRSSLADGLAKGKSRRAASKLATQNTSPSLAA
jgi:hypothetical protein